MSAPPTLTVLSLGGGVQSSVMALMAGEGAFDRTPDCAGVFADTRWEPPSVYEHLEWLRDRLSFSLPPEMAEQVQQVLKEEGRTMSEFLREAIRLYMDEREWLRRERRQRAESRRNEQQRAEGGGTDE